MLRDNPDLHLVAIVPRYPDVDGRLSLSPNLVGRQQALDLCRQAGRGRAHVYDLENHPGTTVYVHAKVCVIRLWAVPVNRLVYDPDGRSYQERLSGAKIAE